MSKYRNCLLVCAAVGLLVVVGCAPPPSPLEDPGMAVARHGPLAIGIAVSPKEPAPGQNITVTVAVENRGRHPETIVHAGSARVLLTVSRLGLVGWDEIRTYPRARAMLLHSYELKPGASFTESVSVRVDPDWPVGELLRVRARLSGRDEVAVAEFVTVRPRN